MHRHLPLVSLIFAAVLNIATAADPFPRTSWNFNPGWKVFVGDPTNASDPRFDDREWKGVTLPYAWNEDAAFRVSIAEHPTGVAWYRKTFRLPADTEGKKVFLEFEGVRQAGEFYLNGRHIGSHENGVMAVGFDISDVVRPAPEENVVAVRTDNAWDYREKATRQRYQWSDRNFNANYGGIPKNVKLHVTGELYQTLPLWAGLETEGVYIFASDFDIAAGAATVTAESQVRNESDAAREFEYEVRVEELDGRLLKSFSGGKTTVVSGATAKVKASARLSGLQFWSWGYGYLYNIQTILKADGLVVDTVETRTGFRKTEYGSGMVKLNGRVLQMKGYAQRTSNEWPALGSAVPPWLSDFSNGLMVEGNANLVRWMHITPSKQDVESCDRVGLIQAMPAGDAEADVSGRRWEQRVELMREAIIYNRNNPSILFYEAGNTGVSEAHMSEIKALRDRFDPHGGRAVGSREMLDSQAAEYGGEMLYINKSARLPFWAMEYSRDEGLRKYWDAFSPPFHKDGDGPLYRNAPAPDYNRNQDSHAIENIVRWFDYWRERPGTGTRVSSGGVNIIFSDSNTHYRGAENYRRSGEVDAMRIPKDGFWAHEVMWDGWVDVERPRIHLLGHWNYATNVTKDVHVVSSAEVVKLFVNGEQLPDAQQSHRFLFTVKNVNWQRGVLRAVGYDRNGKPVCETERQTADEPSAIRLKAITAPAGLKADGNDVALIEVDVTDASGRRCPTALNLVEFELTGPGEWRGGIAQGPENFILAKSLPVECGVNRVLVRSRQEAGRITVTARSGTLKSASLEITSHPVQVSDGLTHALPAEGLPVSLRRGPTPRGPSFTVSRVSIPIAKASAGSQNDTAAASFDDNERTSWTSAGSVENAWIAYELEREAEISEVELKLTGWRQRSYPIEIFVGDKSVYRGRTPRSLGYVTLPVPVTHGRSVRIQLMDASHAEGGPGNTELQNQQNAATGGERQSRNALSIVEAEIYESR
ncbi:MAG TPA: DUF4982 domain-containing protein [Verrucomicrobiae bacterium]|nr:DUF4982 domain-containing protein [Verrucomicrobiae bacterium]